MLTRFSTAIIPLYFWIYFDIWASTFNLNISLSITSLSIYLPIQASNNQGEVNEVRSAIWSLVLPKCQLMRQLVSTCKSVTTFSIVFSSKHDNYPILGSTPYSQWLNPTLMLKIVSQLIYWLQSRDARPTPQKVSLAPPPRPAEIDKTCGAQRGKADYRLHRLCPHIWAKSWEIKEKLFIWYFVQLVII